MKNCKKLVWIILLVLLAAFALTACADTTKDPNPSSSPSTGTPTQYTVSFNVNGGDPVAAQTLTGGSSIAAPPAATKAGLDFAGWFADAAFSGSAVTFPYTPTASVTLHAKWTLTVTFNANGGSLVASQTLNEGAGISDAPVTTKEGFAVVGWFDNADFDGDAAVFPYTPTASVTLYCKWIKTFTVSFDTNGGTLVAAQTLNEGQSIAAEPVTGKTGFTFGGWFVAENLGGVAVVFPYEPAADITLHAKWVITVTFDANGGDAVAPQTLNIGDNLTSSPSTAKSDFTFGGWYDNAEFNGDAVEFPYEPDANITLYAKWVITVTFNTNGGTEVSPQVVTEGAAIASAPTTTKSGYAVAGWYSDIERLLAVTFPYYPDADVTLYVKWVETFEIEFVVNGGSAVATITVNDGSSITNEPTTTKEGFTFGGWYDNAEFNGSAVEFPYEPSSGVTLYAKWTITVTFNTNGGSDVAAQTLNEGQSVTVSPNTTRDGCNFGGWYDNAEFNGSAVEFPYEPDANITLYARWTITVTFYTDGGSDVASITINVGSSILDMPVTTRYNSVFDGWYDDFSFAGGSMVTFPYTPSGNITLYARWGLGGA